jgi:hypothetical protein
VLTLCPYLPINRLVLLLLLLLPLSLTLTLCPYLPINRLVLLLLLLPLSLTSPAHPFPLFASRSPFFLF